MCYRSKIWLILSNLYHDLLAFRLLKKGSHQRSLFYSEEKYAMSLVLAEHLYSIKLFFKYQICLAIKKELDINQVLFHFIQYLDIIQIRMEDHHPYLLVLPQALTEEPPLVQNRLGYCSHNHFVGCCYYPLQDCRHNHLGCCYCYNHHLGYC